jgi:hypothetical protein
MTSKSMALLSIPHDLNLNSTRGARRQALLSVMASTAVLDTGKLDHSLTIPYYSYGRSPFKSDILQGFKDQAPQEAMLGNSCHSSAYPVDKEI